jgi:hypothetical protein
MRHAPYREFFDVQIHHVATERGDDDVRPFQRAERVDRIEANADVRIVQRFDDPRQRPRFEAVVILNRQPNIRLMESGQGGAYERDHFLWLWVVRFGIDDHPQNGRAEVAGKLDPAVQVIRLDAARAHFNVDIPPLCLITQMLLLRGRERIEREIIGVLHQPQAELISQAQQPESVHRGGWLFVTGHTDVPRDAVTA